MEEQNVEYGNGLIKEVLFAIKRNLILIIVTVMLCSACGLGYSFIKTPNYTATEEVIYSATDEKGSYAGTATSINIMRAYFNTVIDFCDEGVVIDRANAYYIMFLTENDPSLTVDEFIAGLESNDSYSGDQSKQDWENTYILKSNVKINAEVEGNEQDLYTFSISYTDVNPTEAEIKLKIYVEAISRELKAVSSVDDGSGTEDKYFSGIGNEIISLGLTGVVSDVSKTKLTIIGFILGVLIASALVYIISITDSSIKTKDELEDIVGVKHFANIDYIGGKK